MILRPTTEILMICIHIHIITTTIGGEMLGTSNIDKLIIFSCELHYSI